MKQVYLRYSAAEEVELQVLFNPSVEVILIIFWGNLSISCQWNQWRPKAKSQIGPRTLSWPWDLSIKSHNKQWYIKSLSIFKCQGPDWNFLFHKIYMGVSSDQNFCRQNSANPIWNPSILYIFSDQNCHLVHTLSSNITKTKLHFLLLMILVTFRQFAWLHWKYEVPCCAIYSDHKVVAGHSQ